MDVKLAIENFEPSSEDGFALSYIISMDFLNAAPTSAEEPPISFSMDKSPPDQ